VSFVVTSLGGSQVELHPGGASEPLRVGPGGNDAQFYQELFSFRLGEMSKAARAVRAGLETQLPPSALALLRGDELERLVCGCPVVDLALLKSATDYTSCSPSDQHVVWFWEVLEHDFSEDDRRAFLRFAWGRSRLPLTRAAFAQPFKIQSFNKSPPDIFLPVSHTCFFSIELPRYSTRDILRAKLSYGKSIRFVLWWWWRW
jgi:hypothetical protein